MDMPAELPKVESYASLGIDELVSAYARGVDEIDPRVAELSAEQVDTAFLASAGVGKLPIRVVIGHLADADVVFSHRMRRAVAEDGPILADFDHEAFIDAGLYGVVSPREGDEARAAPALGASIAAMHAVRQWTASWLVTLRAEDLAREALHPANGAMSVRRMVEYMTWHAAYHGVFIRAKVEKLVG